MPQGGLLPPAQFHVYINELSEQLSDYRTGFMLGNILISHLVYTDDLIIFSPSSNGCQQLLNISDHGPQNQS